MLHYSTFDDNYLLHLLAQDDGAAFTEIYNRYWERLFYKAGKKLNSLPDAENIVQDIFLDIWRRRNELQVTGELSHYLSVALKFRIINYHSRQQHLSVYKDHLLRTDKSSAQTTEEWIACSELNSRMATLVNKLPEKCQLAFRLREEGLSQKEIAGEMGVSENTVQTHIGRALKALRSGVAQLFHLFF